MYKKSVNRIVIGDVGSGKTIIAFLTALTYMKSLEKSVVVLLAPTEVLAFQHYTKLISYLNIWSDNFFDQVDFIYLSNRSIYLNNLKITKKSLTKAELKSHRFYIGTHALLFVSEINPDFVLVDEQHRFGVSQRQHLTTSKNDSEKEFSPHFVSFTATPIPRTLALTVFQSLKPLFLKSLKFREKILTNIVSFVSFEDKVVDAIKAELDKKRKIYVICARVEDKEEGEEDLWSVKKAVDTLEGFFPDRILSVHGKLKNKKDILKEFKDSTDKHILVATTVVEVGVDVAEATLVVILNAEKFGLSALHQIRGRVGRNSYQDNQCLLVTTDQYLRSRRLKYLCQYQDGFEIAEKDLELRGGGDIIGKAQSGFEEDIQNLMGLNQEMYYNITELVNSLDLTSLEKDMPRLYNYLEKESAKVWEE
ncbi:MAG: DEAD/DEAH box helicase [Patescibacteria group bacterium]